MADNSPATAASAPATAVSAPVLFNIGGKQLSVIFYNGILYRADKLPFRKSSNLNTNYSTAQYVPTQTVSASEVYTQQPIKYFTEDRGVVERVYAQKGAPFIYTWQTRVSLVLLNMTDRETHKNVLELLQKNYQKQAILQAFRPRDNVIERFSSIDTQSMNDLALETICSLGHFDGYYTPTQEWNNNIHFDFHSEVGLCAAAFSKLRLVRIDHVVSIRNVVNSSWQTGVNPATRKIHQSSSKFTESMSSSASSGLGFGVPNKTNQNFKFENLPFFSRLASKRKTRKSRKHRKQT
jgi:hypothetical protein